MKKVLIAGGSGLIGSSLTKKLQKTGYEVMLLSRKKNPGSKISTFLWDPENEFIEPGALEGVDYIINLAGANVAGKSWTAAYKEEIMQSRIQAANTLYLHLKRNPGKVRKLVNSSAIGFYPDSPAVMHETDKPGRGFLSEVVQAWEQTALKIEKLDIPVCIFRTGIVLAKEGGFLPTMQKPIRFFLGSGLGSGKQYISWIHIDDLVEMMILALEKDTIHGIYNAVAPEPVTNKAITKAIASKMGRPVFLPNVPAFVLEKIFGEFSSELLADHKVSPEKITGAGFRFKYPDLDTALQNLLKNG